MSLAQEILKGQFSHIDGWQSTLLVQIDGFIPIKGEAIQIHLVSDTHWVTASSLGGKVTVYDCRKYNGHAFVIYYNSSVMSSIHNND